MNFYLLNLIGKWLNLLMLTIIPSISYQMQEQNFGQANKYNKNTNVVSKIIDYKTIKNYDSSLPLGRKKIVVSGQQGVMLKNNYGKNIYIRPVINEKIVIGTGRKGEHKGVMTGYGPDCSTCNGLGVVACKTRDRKSFNIIDDDIYYNDLEYGKARVLAADLSYFPCGTIVEVNSPNLGKFIGIVMDTGYTMREQYKKGIFHFDVAYKTEKDENIRFATNMSGNVEFNVQRWGW